MRTFLALLGILITGLGLRLIHLLNGSHYFLLGPDSFWFHQQAQYVEKGLPIGGIIGSGLTYPMAAVGAGLGASFFPPVMAVLTGAAIYYFTRRFYGNTVALWSTLAFAVAFPAVWLTMGGMCDRDSLTLFLITIGVFGYMVSKTWRGGIWVLIIAGLLAIEWHVKGALILCITVLGLFAADVYHRKSWDRFQTILPLCVAFFIVWPVYYTDARGYVNEYLTYRAIRELAPFSIKEVLFWLPLALPIIFGSVFLWKRRTQTDVFMLAWAAVSILMGLVAVKYSLYLIPAVCIMAGAGINSVIQSEAIRRQGKLMFYSLTVFLVLISFGWCWSPPKNALMPTEWEDALIWVKENTNEESRIMSWWDYGWWILDVAERNPVAEGGDVEADVLRDVASAYCATDDGQVIASMQNQNAQYLILSSREKEIFPAIQGYARQVNYSDNETLFWRIADGQREFDRLWVSYSNRSVVVLVYR